MTVQSCNHLGQVAGGLEELQGYFPPPRFSSRTQDLAESSASEPAFAQCAEEPEGPPQHTLLGILLTIAFRQGIM
jgi:hypothetical protein